MKLLDALRIEGASIDSEIQRSNLFSHMGDRGEFREKIVERFLRPFLPPHYGLAPGEVFASDGQQSAQVDIVIYDAIFSTVLYRTGTRYLFPAESIFGSIEVKSNLSRAELETACINVASIKGLNRQRTDSLDILPHFRLGLGVGLSGGGDFRNPYLGFVFGYHGATAETVVADLMERLVSEPSRKQMLPDFIFVRDPGYMIFRAQAGSIPVQPAQLGGEFTEFRAVPTGIETLPLFFVTLNTCLGQLRLRSPDFNALWIQLAHECISNTITRPLNRSPWSGPTQP
jgi:hypothetical protein